MTNRYFSVLNDFQAIQDGTQKLNSGSSGVYRGMLAGYPSGGSLGTSTGSAPYGQFNDYLRNEEYPTSQDLGTANHVSSYSFRYNFVLSHWKCCLIGDLFSHLLISGHRMS